MWPYRLCDSGDVWMYMDIYVYLYKQIRGKHFAKVKQVLSSCDCILKIGDIICEAIYVRN